MRRTHSDKAAFFGEWPTWAMLCLCYSIWLAAGLFYSSIGWACLPVMAIAAALHASLQHEALHGHPTRYHWLNEALVSLPLSVFFPYRRFKQLHLRHHHNEHLTDPYDDPESYYRTKDDWLALPKLMQHLLTLNNTLAGRIVLGPALMVAGFIYTEAGVVARNEKGARRAWLYHAAGLIALGLVVETAFNMPLWFYGLAVAYPALSLIAIRTFCEHQWAQTTDGKTIIVENSAFLSWLFLNNNLHLVHHTEPTLPWYQLPAHYKSSRDYWVAKNDGYVFDNYIQIALKFLIASKEPVVHPDYRDQLKPAEKGSGSCELLATHLRHEIVIPSKPTDI